MGRHSLLCLAAITLPFTTIEGQVEIDDPGPVAEATLSVCNLGGPPDNDGTILRNFPGDDYPGYEVFAGRVGLPTARTLQAAPAGLEDSSAAFFSKAGLNVKPDRPFTLVVPRNWRERLSIAWGGARRTLRLRVDLECGDAPDDTWVGYPGGYWIDEPACAPLIVKTEGSARRVRLGIGAPCDFLPSTGEPDGERQAATLP